MGLISRSKVGKVIGNITVGTSKTVDAEWLTADAKVEVDSKNTGILIHVSISLSVANKVEITFDSGTTWHKLNSDLLLAADVLHAFEIPCVDGDLVNFRSKTATTDINRGLINQRGIL